VTATAILLAFVLLSFIGVLQSRARAAEEGAYPDIRLELSPRICTLATNDKQCETRVHAQWHSPRDESLCLVIVDRPDVKRCWEHYSEGTYTVELVFADDLVFQLRDLDLQHVLATEALRVIREAIRYRHKRRQPWNIFD
jgi:Protein of unknown function (DUF3019)